MNSQVKQHLPYKDLVGKQFWNYRGGEEATNNAEMGPQLFLVYRIRDHGPVGPEPARNEITQRRKMEGQGKNLGTLN